MKKEIHEVHNYIRDNTKISNEDKSLFIADCMVGLKNNLLSLILGDIENKENIYSILRKHISRK
jgi:hypothetical protein